MAEPSNSDAAIPGNVRPIVATGGTSNLGLWAFMAIILLGGLWLFSTLNANRETLNAQRASLPEDISGRRISAPAAPALPQRFLDPPNDRSLAERTTLRSAPDFSVPRNLAPPPPPIASTPPVPLLSPEILDPEPASTFPPRPEIVYNRVSSAAGSMSESSADDDAERVRAGRLANPSLTVPLGTIIPAVLETALDSTRAGGVRALVQRDVYSFDGSRVLIPRGSRLHGIYEADVERGQNRALIQWTRLIRPDGVTISLDSPASDPLGRAGVKGKVDGKFFQRFGGAILQSVLDIGVGVAVREASDGVIVALPGSTQNVTGVQPQDIKPTLKVKHGTSVSVYVARDLDFASVDF